MSQQLSLRLPDDLARELGRRARRLRMKRSALVKDALRRFLATEGAAGGFGGKPYERVRDLLGIYRSGVPDLGLRHREHLIRRLRRGR